MKFFGRSDASRHRSRAGIVFPFVQCWFQAHLPPRPAADYQGVGTKLRAERRWPGVLSFWLYEPDRCGEVACFFFHRNKIFITTLTGYIEPDAALVTDS